MLTVLTYLWTDPIRKRDYTFTHDHVRILKNMVERHLDIPHRFVCITDEEIEGVETAGFLNAPHVPGTCARKLVSWHPMLGEYLDTNRILVLDIDIVIVDDITPLINPGHTVCLFRNPNYVEGGNRAFYQGSVQLLNAGARPHVYENIFKPWARQIVNYRFGGFEQAWLSEMLSWHEAYWDDTDGIYGAGRLGGAGIYDSLPENARIVVFPGNRMPDQDEMKKQFPWIEEHYR